MAPTVCMAEVGERLGHLDHMLNINYCIGEKRKSLQNRKRPLRHIKPYHKLQMGLVIEECRQPTRCESPSFDCESDTSESSEHSPRRDSLVHITLRTLALLRRNQQLQHKLNMLQAETRAFVESVLSTSPPDPLGN